MRKDRLYPAALVLIFAALALVRRDLVIGAFDAAVTELGSGWASAAWIVFEGLLLGSILLMTFRAVARDPDPLLDGLVAASACVYGYLAELAGTTLALWTYYTGEEPPLWIIPAWPLGALVVTRLSGRVS
ncbi:MAG TPA: hypothetical protein PL037_05850, partial [Elusimicrobiales bacterium]|nr:hypothetical protein [Elusimicrobiales bacterium]